MPDEQRSVIVEGMKFIRIDLMKRKMEKDEKQEKSGVNNFQGICRN